MSEDERWESMLERERARDREKAADQKRGIDRPKITMADELAGDQETVKRFVESAYEGEPLFVIRGRDALAIPVLAAYVRQCEEHQLYGQGYRVGMHVSRFRDWQARNAKLTHLPDPPVGFHNER